MSTRSVRLDEESEVALEDITRATGKSISSAIKHGLLLYRNEVNNSRKASDFFANYDIGEGGYALGPARNVSKILKMKLRE